VEAVAAFAPSVPVVVMLSVSLVVVTPNVLRVPAVVAENVSGVAVAAFAVSFPVVPIVSV
jgi:hypothetical protein